MNSNELSINEIIDINSISLFGGVVSKEDIDIILDSFSRISKHYNADEIIKILSDHWNNMVSCIKLACESDKNFIMKRNEIFVFAEKKGSIIQYGDKGDLLRAWERELNTEIERDNLKFLRHMRHVSFETGSLFGRINGKKFRINLKTIRYFFKRATKKVHNLNEKAFSAIKELVEYTKNVSGKRPWRSPIYIFVIVLLVLFTLGITTAIDLSFGLIALIYKISFVMCLLCTFYHNADDLVSLGEKVLKKIGLS